MTCYTNITKSFKSMNDSPNCPFLKKIQGGHRNVNFELSACKWSLLIPLIGLNCNNLNMSYKHLSGIKLLCF